MQPKLGWSERRDAENAEASSVNKSRPSPFGLRWEAKRHTALEALASAEKRCRRCALPPQSKILPRRGDFGARNLFRFNPRMFGSAKTFSCPMRDRRPKRNKFRAPFLFGLLRASPQPLQCYLPSSSRPAKIFNAKDAEVGAEERGGGFSLQPLREPLRPLRLISLRGS